LDVKYGPSHSEVILVDGEPCLVETGARMHGLKGPKMLEYGTGVGTHELAVDVAVNGARLFNQLYDAGGRYCLKKYVFEVNLRSEKRGILLDGIDRPEIRALPSVMDIFPSVHAGDEVQLTVDLATSPGLVLLCHCSLDACLADIQKIRDMESTSLYKIAAHNAHSMAQEQRLPPGCLAQSRQACWRWCFSRPAPRLHKGSKAPAPSPSIMSPCKVGFAPLPSTETSLAFEITELDASTDIAEK